MLYPPPPWMPWRRGIDYQTNLKPHLPSAAVVITPFLIVAALSINFSAEHIEAVANVEHGV